MSGFPKRITLIRHAQSISNVDARPSRDNYDARLSISGRHQAAFIGAGISSMCHGSEEVKHCDLLALYDLLILSPLKRCQETYDHSMIKKTFNFKTIIAHDNRCRELKDAQHDFSRHEKYLWDSVSQNDFQEPWYEYRKRVRRFVKWLRTRPERNICIISHCDFIRAFTQATLSEQNLRHGKWLKNACSITVSLEDVA